jgi:molybdopterin/thiamine biosynthesis adenylyltransferase
MNPTALFMYDDDIVEQANMSGQLYCQGDVGKAKVDAMADMISSYTTMHNIYAIQDKFKADSEAGDVMICGFDNMEARRIFFVAWNNHVMAKPEEERHKCLYLDGRLSINTLQVFCITGDNDWAMVEYADKYLFTDAEAEETQCSLKQTTYLACMIGSMIVNLFTNWTANLLNPIIPYDLPFFTEYDAQNMIFKTIK